MRKFHCQCGQRVFFDSYTCVACGAELGFDPATLTMLTVSRDEDSVLRETGQSQLGFAAQGYEFCANRSDYHACNWLKDPNDGHTLCQGCRLNRTIPNLSDEKNLDRWRQFEIAKKRLIYGLLSLGLPVKDGFDDPEKGLLLDFIEDQRSAPEHYPETFVTTGYQGGVITLNAMEADDAVRESIRIAMNESYRTLLGHLRHESGHYYWSLLNPQTSLLESFEKLFGDPSIEYRQALNDYYEKGPQAEWQRSYISAYASSHPLEDWAETWAHYLLIQDALETARENGLLDPWLNTGIEHGIRHWADLSVAFNEINRGSGLGDTYPFVLNEAVAEKLQFVDIAVNQLRGMGI